MQLLKTQPTPAHEAFGSLVKAQAELARTLNAELVAEHDLTIGEFEVMMLLARAEDRRLRRVDLASEITRSASGITRLLARLEADGLVEKGFCASDARVTYAVLTDSGLAKLNEIAPGHQAAVDQALAQYFNADELTTLRDLLGRISGPADCSVPE